MTTTWAAPPDSFDLPADSVHVWRIHLKADAVDPAQFKNVLNAEERERATRFRFATDYNRYVVGRGALRILLGSYASTQPTALQFTYSKHGKPALASPYDETQLQFNVSHSGAVILIALAHRHAVGVDVEAIERRVAEERIAERFFSPDEVAQLRSLPETAQHAAFFECWTRKEAFIKAHGEGLSLPLDSFSVAFGPNEAARLVRFEREPGPDEWTLRAPTVGEGYAAAVCVAAPEADMACFGYRGTAFAH